MTADDFNNKYITIKDSKDGKLEFKAKPFIEEEVLYVTESINFWAKASNKVGALSTKSQQSIVNIILFLKNKILDNQYLDNLTTRSEYNELLGQLIFDGLKDADGTHIVNPLIEFEDPNSGVQQEVVTKIIDYISDTMDKVRGYSVLTEQDFISTHVKTKKVTYTGFDTESRAIKTSRDKVWIVESKDTDRKPQIPDWLDRYAISKQKESTLVGKTQKSISELVVFIHNRFDKKIAISEEKGRLDEAVANAYDDLIATLIFEGLKGADGTHIVNPLIEFEDPNSEVDDAQVSNIVSYIETELAKVKPDTHDAALSSRSSSSSAA